MEINWEKMIELAKKKAHVTSDAEIARILGIGRAAISEWRNGRNDLGMLTKLRLLDLLAYQGARDMLLALLPDDKAKEIIELNNEITKRSNTNDNTEKKK